MSAWNLKQIRENVYQVELSGTRNLNELFEEIKQMILEDQLKQKTIERSYWSMEYLKPYYLLRTEGKLIPNEVARDFIVYIETNERLRCEQKCINITNFDNNKERNSVDEEADGGEEEIKLEERDPAAPMEIKFMEVEEEESDDSSSSESVGVMPNLSDDDGEMSAPIIVEDDEEMSALASSRDNREMSAPVVSRDTEEMSALGISNFVWLTALKGRFNTPLRLRKWIIAKAMQPNQVLPRAGTLEWRRLDLLVSLERLTTRRNSLRCRDLFLREEARKEFLRIEEFYYTTGFGSYKNARTLRRLRSELL